VKIVKQSVTDSRSSRAYFTSSDDRYQLDKLHLTIGKTHRHYRLFNLIIILRSLIKAGAERGVGRTHRRAQLFRKESQVSGLRVISGRPLINTRSSLESVAMSIFGCCL